MKKIVSGVILAGAACAIFATDARVETMGRNSNFFRDETQIHQNAANLGLYDKIIYGSYGAIARDNDWTTGVDWRPELPHFGAAISFGQKDGSQSKFSIGATFNRVDSALNYVAKNIDVLGLRTTKSDGTGKTVLFAGDSIGFNNNLGDAGDLDLKGKLDLMMAYTLDNGTTIGIGGYLAFQDGARRDLIRGWNVPTTGSSKELQNRFVKGNVGVNTPIGDGVDLEASLGISALTLRGAVPGATQTEKSFYYAADNDIGIQIDARIFADAPSINGAFVPHIQANIFNYGDDERIIDFNAGLGINLNIDRGFFWAGLEGLYNKMSHTLVNAKGENDKYGKKDIIGGRVGFGIERNVFTDWFVIRVGGSKLLAKESRNGDKDGSHWIETADEDHVSLGMGVNVENRLKVDFTVAQNLPYTFTSLFSSGGNPYLMSRVSASFSF